jgi:2-methylisocitrate lyase-like PEP mutase family enzyme
MRPVPHTGIVKAHDRAARLRELHHGPRILVLPNAWDVASARIFEEAGAQAVATTSAGIANALGYPDGEAIPVEEMLWMVERIARGVTVPVTADLESGYGDPAGTAEAAIAAGAVGLNLEDGRHDGDTMLPVAEATAAVAAVREAAERAGVPLVLNARTDVFLRGDASVASAVERGNAYLRAGADCIYAIGVADPETIRALVEAIEGPLSMLARAGGPTVAELEALGVRRVSIGPWAFRAASSLTQRIAEQLLRQGTYAFGDWQPFPDLNSLLSRHEVGTDT